VDEENYSRGAGEIDQYERERTEELERLNEELRASKAITGFPRFTEVPPI
jgi:hypothetical protein